MASPYSEFVDSVFDSHFKTHPHHATGTGIHTFDADVMDVSQDAMKRRVAEVKAELKTLKAFPLASLSAEEKRDLKLIDYHLNSELLELEEVKMWRRDPDYYGSLVMSGIYSLMSRTFDTPEARLRSVIARERKSLEQIKQGRLNITTPPKIYTEVALQQLPGTINFLKNDVPLAFAAVKDKALLAEFEASNNAIMAALKDYEDFLRKTVLPKSTGNFKLGKALYQKKLLYEEMVSIPLPELLKIGMDNLRKNQAAFMETAKRIDPKKTPKQLLAEMEKDHPAPEDLLPTVRKQTEEAQDFLIAKGIVTLPSKLLPIVQETPPFMRALTFASMDTPGPYETVAKEAYYNVTGPDATMTKAEIEEHMAGFSRPVTSIISVHEAYPGHYVQFLWVPKAPSKVRKILGTNTNIEGWAHYCEQMMLDEGFGNNDPKLRLGQLHEALLRNARFIVSIQMHAGDMTYNQAIEFFKKEGYQTPSAAKKETTRGTNDATYLYYTLGKLQILKLREDYRAMKGDKYSLKEFHDAFLSRGFPPVEIVREEILTP